MKLRILVVAMLVSTLALISSTAAAKGLEDVTVTGPGLAGPIQLSDDSANELARKSVFWTDPDRSSAGSTDGALGPRYVATYRWFLGRDESFSLRQDLYPFADAGPLTYTPPRQAAPGGTSRGGWSRAGPELTLLLVAAGVPVPPSYTLPVPVVAPPPLTG